MYTCNIAFVVVDGPVKILACKSEKPIDMDRAAQLADMYFDEGINKYHKFDQTFAYMVDQLQKNIPCSCVQITADVTTLIELPDQEGGPLC